MSTKGVFSVAPGECSARSCSSSGWDSSAGLSEFLAKMAYPSRVAGPSATKVSQPLGVLGTGDLSPHDPGAGRQGVKLANGHVSG